MTPRVPEEGKLRANSRGLGPPIGVRDLPASVRTSHARRTNIPPGRGPGAPRVPQAQAWARVFQSSARRLAHPPHSMRVVEACSAATARGAAFVRPHCGPRITKEHSAAACAAPTQSPSAALNGYDGTALFHHAAYAASYTARSATWQATPLATIGAVSTRQRLDMLNAGFQEQARKSRREISFTSNAIMYEQYAILYYIVGSTCQGPSGHVCASLLYLKGTRTWLLGPRQVGPTGAV